MNPIYSIAELVPHAAPMSLLNEIIDYGDDWLQARATISPDNLFLINSGIPSWVGIEYMAQAIAAWAGTRALNEGREIQIGFLVGTRKYNVNIPEFAVSTELTINVKQILQGQNGLAVFECNITGTDIEGRQFKASASINVYQPENNDDILKEQS